MCRSFSTSIKARQVYFWWISPLFIWAMSLESWAIDKLSVFLGFDPETLQTQILPYLLTSESPDAFADQLMVRNIGIWARAHVSTKQFPVGNGRHERRGISFYSGVYGTSLSSQASTRWPEQQSISKAKAKACSDCLCQCNSFTIVI